MITNVICLLLLASLAVLAVLAEKIHRQPRRRSATSAKRPTNRNRARNRRITFTPGTLPGRVRPSRNTRCARCHGPVLKSEDVIRTTNKRGVIGPCCYLR